MANKILTVSELAEHLNVHRITIYRLLKSGSLPGFKIGRVWRFDLDEIGNWMASSKSTEAMRAAIDGQTDGRSDGKADGKSAEGKPQKPPAAALRGRGLASKSKR
jgi:excisionase family DNA binding protein